MVFRNRRAFTNLLLFVGVIAMALVAWQDYRQRNAPLRTLLAFPPQAIERMLIEIPGRPRLELQRTPGGWSLREPYSAPLLAERAAYLTELASSQPASRYHLAGRKLADFGLTEPRALLTLTTAERSLTLAFGGTDITSGRRYLRLGDEILLLEDRYFPLLDAGLSALADLSLVDGGLQAVLLPDGSRIDAPERLDDWRIARAAGIEARGNSAREAVQLLMSGGYRRDLGLLAHPAGYALQPADSAYQLVLGRALGARLGLPDPDEL
jgi:hypothetical protein